VTSSTYDRIGSDYRLTRKEDPRLARLIARELQGARTVLNAARERARTNPPIGSSSPSIRRR